MATTKRADQLKKGDRIEGLRGLGGGGTVIGSSPHADPRFIRVGYRYGSESWQKTLTTFRCDARIEVER